MSKQVKVRIGFMVPLALAIVIASTAHLRYGRASGIPAGNAMLYAGTLNENGAPVTGMRAFTLMFWDHATATAATNKKCETTASTTTVTNGRFRIPLDPTCTVAVAANPDLWIEIVVGSMSLGRKKLGATPYAVEADRASNAAGALAQQIVPSGAVMAFDLAACPPGWSAYAAANGRTIVGTSVVLARGATVGADQVTLTENQMPSHNHDASQTPHQHTPDDAVNFIVGGGAAGKNASIQLNSGGYEYTRFTSLEQPPITVAARGGSQPFDNRQASLALTYCKKN